MTFKTHRAYFFVVTFKQNKRVLYKHDRCCSVEKEVSQVIAIEIYE